MTVWSAYDQGNDGNGLRVGIDLSRSGTTITYRYYYQTEFAYNDSQTLHRSGSVTGDVVFQNNGGGPTQINSGTFAGTPGQTHSFSASISGSYNGANPSVGTSLRIPYNPPAAPSIPAVSRVSDTQHTVTWSRNATSIAPYSSQRVQRRTYDTSWGAWTTVANVSGSATSWSDTTTRSERVYEYRIVADNESGTAIGPAYGQVYTTPKPPTSATATKSGSDIVVTWVNGPNYSAYDIEVYRSSAGGAYTLVATVGSGTTWTDVAPNAAQTHQYRVRTKTTSYATLFSGYSTTAVVQLQAPPNAPTNLAPTTVRDAAGNITFTWTHNPVDTTAQTQFQVRHRSLGSGTWTTVPAVTSGVSQWILPAGTYANGTTVEWQVATRGAHASFGPFSASANTPTSATPTVAINSPTDGQVVTTSSLIVEWGYAQAQSSPQTAWVVELLSGGVAVEQQSGIGDTSAVALNTALLDGTSWQVRVRATSAAGLTSAYDTNAFTVDYALPPTPVVTADWFPEDATVTVDVAIPAPGAGEVAATSVDVFRSVDAGLTWSTVAAGVPYDGGAIPVSVTDYGPRVHGVTQYRAETVSATPSRASSTTVSVTTPEVDDPTPAPQVWLGAGPMYAQHVHSGGNVSVVRGGGGLQRVLRQYAGRVLPVEHTGTQRARTWAVSFDVIVDPDGTPALGSDPRDWLALDLVPGPMLLRIYDGDDYAVVSIGGSLQVQRGPSAEWNPTIYQVSFTATEVVP